MRPGCARGQVVRDVSAVRRMLALALGARLRHGAADAAGWAHRDNADGLDGLSYRHGGGTPRLLSPNQEQELARWVVEGPDLAQARLGPGQTWLSTV